MSWLTGWHQAEATRKLLNLFLGFPSRVLPSLWNTDMLVEPVHPFTISSHVRPPCRAATHFPSETLFPFLVDYLPGIWARPRAGKKNLKQQPRKSCGLWKPSSRAPLLLTKDSRRLGQQTEKWHVQWFPQEFVSRLGWVGSTEPFQSHLKLYFVSLPAHKGYCPVSKERAITHIWGAAVSKERWDTLSSPLAPCLHCQPPPSPNTLPVLSSSVTTGRNRASASVESLL